MIFFFLALMYNCCCCFCLWIISFLLAPSAPLNVLLSTLSPEAVSVSWSPPSMSNGVVTSYRVTYFPTVDGGRGSAATVNTSTGLQLSLNVTGLEPFTNYTVVVAAMTEFLGSESDPVTVRTAEAGM